MNRRNNLILYTLAIIFLSCGNDKENKTICRYKNEIFTSVNVTKDITYGQALTWDGNTEILKLDLYEPDEDSEMNRPAVVWIHGGGFVGGDKTNSAFVQLSENFAKRGYLCVSINYRIVTDARFAAEPVDTMTNAMFDAKAAVRWLRANASVYRVDSNHIAIGGGSAGAYTALHTAYIDGEGTSGNPGYSSTVTCVIDFWGGMYQFSAINSGEAPLIIIHGTDDATVPFSNAEKLVQFASAAGIPYQFYPLQGTGHAAWNNLELYITWIVPFLYEYNINE